MDTIGNNAKNWYALYVNVRHEKRIIERMKEKGIESYCPFLRKMRQWSDRKKLVEMPLMPGYLFVRVGNDELDKPRFINGVVNFVRFEGKPAIIRETEIEGLKYFVEYGYGLEQAGDTDLKIGDRVQFRLSDFRAYAAVVEKFEGDAYAIVTFEGLGKNYRLKAPKESLLKKTSR